MTDTLHLKIDFPISANGMYQYFVSNGNGTKGFKRGTPQRYLSPKYKEFTAKQIPLIEEQIKEQCWISCEDDQFVIDIKLVQVDKRKRDIDNYIKTLFDVMTKAGVYPDDSQIIEYTAKKIVEPKDKKSKEKKEPYCVVSIKKTD